MATSPFALDADILCLVENGGKYIEEREEWYMNQDREDFDEGDDDE